MEGTAQEVISCTEVRMEWVTVNNMWKIVHSRWTVVLQLAWIMLERILCGRYSTAGGQLYCSLSVVCYSEK